MSDSPTQHSILIIDDSEDVTIPLEAYFKQEGVAVTIAQGMSDGLATALKERPNIILLAATLGGVDGLGIFHHLRDAPLTAHIPIMFIADYMDASRQNQLLAAGADDVITRPFDVEILALRVRNAIKRASREGLTDGITGLPTTPVLEEKRRELAAQTGWIALTITLDHFDSFRARYDFITGNEVLRFAANTIAEIAAEKSEGMAFVGCPAEAQFVILATGEQIAAIEAAVQTRLSEGMLNFYNFMEREQGFVQIEDGRGGMEQFPLMAVQITRETLTRETLTSEDPASEDITSEDSAPEETASEELAPGELASEDPAPEDHTPEDLAPGDITSEDSAPEEPASEELAPGELVPEDLAPEDQSPEDLAAAPDKTTE